MPKNHKPNCTCFICKAKRGGTKGKNSSRFGTHPSEETLVKMRKPRSKEACANIKEGCKKRPPRTEESKRKNGEAHKGVPKPSKLIGRTYEDIYGDRAEELCIKRRGKNNGMWQGGHSINYNPEFSRMVPIIRERDGVCQICGKTPEENGEELSVHHIDYDKNNNDPDNLVSLCRSDHVGTNANREYWQYYFEVCWLTPNKQLLVA